MKNLTYIFWSKTRKRINFSEIILHESNTKIILTNNLIPYEKIQTSSINMLKYDENNYSNKIKIESCLDKNQLLKEEIYQSKKLHRNKFSLDLNFISKIELGKKIKTKNVSEHFNYINEDKKEKAFFNEKENVNFFNLKNYLFSTVKNKIEEKNDEKISAVDFSINNSKTFNIQTSSNLINLNFNYKNECKETEQNLIQIDNTNFTLEKYEKKLIEDIKEKRTYKKRRNTKTKSLKIKKTLFENNQSLEH